MTQATLRGARFRRARWNPGARMLELQLETHDLLVLLRYRNVGTLEPALPVLAALIEDVNVRVGDEVSGEGWHRFTLVPAGEIRVEYGAVQRFESPAPGADYGDPGYRFDVQSC